MSDPLDSPCKPPSAPTFSFKAPFPASSSSSPTHKQRRVSLALPSSSPREVPPWTFRDDTGLDSHVPETLIRERKGKMRKIAPNESDQDDVDPPLRMQEKKQRKKWTMEETQMLVDGCNRWGVGNWKAILKDPKLKFDNRSPVDLKDRFRTYFPDAYKQHYPNAKTHLSSKVRSTLPDGTSLFEKTRSKRRRPFTEEEDRALKAGYEKHGTVWAAIVKDPVFLEQNRRSTDLRDRFRNAFPDLYQAAGYKPRNAPKTKREPVATRRAATDDQLDTSSGAAGPVRRRRAHTTQGWLRGGTKSVPESTTCSEDEDSSGGEEDKEPLLPMKLPLTDGSISQPEESCPSDTHAEMDTDKADPMESVDPLLLPDFVPSSSHSLSTEITDSSQSQGWIDPPGWSAGSPTSPDLSADYFLGTASPFNRRADGAHMIGKSAWGAQDWFSANPRLDGSGLSSDSSSFVGGISPVPSSPFSFHNLNHGVVDRYDLLPTSFPHDFASEVGPSDTHSTFSDPEMFTSNNFRGFTHHSNYAGDLIFGARTHQPQPSQYGSGFGFGTPGLGLSVSDMPPPAGIHPMQLHSSPLPGIDEIELASITLDDHVDPPTSLPPSIGRSADGRRQDTETQGPLDIQSLNNFELHSLDDLIDLGNENHATPPATPISTSRSLRGVAHVQSTAPRSISVPPLENRVPAPRPVQQHAYSDKFMTIGRTVPLFDPMTLSLDLGSLPFTHLPLSTPPVHDSARQFSDPSDLPFLDLHYYSTHPGLDFSADAAYKAPSAGQALDLARPSGVQHQHQHQPHTLRPPAAQQSFGSAAGKLHSSHQRGQSVVSPQELLVRNAADNKRKRASWDGGVS